MLRLVAGSLVDELLDMRSAIGLVREGMIAASGPGAVQPPRWMMEIPTAPHAVLGLMPGFLSSSPLFGAKITAVYPENHRAGLSSHQSLIVLYEKANGRPVALVDGAQITAIRTAAASAVATDALAVAGAEVMAVLGTGVQAERHVEALLAVRPITTLRLWGRSTAAASQLARKLMECHPRLTCEVSADVQAAVDGAAIVTTVTAAREPILEWEWLAPGAHVNIVGSSSTDALEVAPAVVAKTRLFVDLRTAVTALGGDVNRAVALGLMGWQDIAGEIGEVLTGQTAGRQAAGEITAYKSVGIPAQDLVCANHVVEAAAKQDKGYVAPW